MFKALRINPGDNVATALADLPAGIEADVVSEDGSLSKIRTTVPIPLAHKVALTEIGTGERVVKYGESIGAATRDIHPASTSMSIMSKA